LNLKLCTDRNEIQPPASKLILSGIAGDLTVNLWRGSLAYGRDAWSRQAGPLAGRDQPGQEAHSALLDEEASFLGLLIENGEGDPCDIFVAQYRDAPQDEEDEDEATEA
jgi:hypothetical protein